MNYAEANGGYDAVGEDSLRGLAVARRTARVGAASRNKTKPELLSMKDGDHQNRRQGPKPKTQNPKP